MLDHQLYLPESWCEDTKECQDRRAKVHIPETVAFQTKPQIAAGLIRMTILLGIVTLDWITADEEYGRNGKFLDEVEELKLRYVVEVPVNTTAWTEDPASCVPPYGGRGRVPTLPTRESVASVVMVASCLSSEAWQTLQIREGAKGPLAFEFAAVRVWAVRHGKAGPPVWLLVRRSLDPTPEVKYYISNADASTPLGVLAEVACTRHAVEDYFEDAKSYLGMAQYETRSWVGWHHHMSLVAMAQTAHSDACEQAAIEGFLIGQSVWPVDELIEDFAQFINCIISELTGHCLCFIPLINRSDQRSAAGSARATAQRARWPVPESAHASPRPSPVAPSLRTP
jgi:SRSO17 transposase